MCPARPPEQPLRSRSVSARPLGPRPMSAVEALRMAVQGVLANRLRAALTMLGITIGVAAVIILVAVGHGSSVAVQQNIENLGTNEVTIMPGFSFGRGSATSQSSFTQFTTKDVKALQDPNAA